MNFRIATFVAQAVCPPLPPPITNISDGFGLVYGERKKNNDSVPNAVIIENRAVQHNYCNLDNGSAPERVNNSYLITYDVKNMCMSSRNNDDRWPARPGRRTAHTSFPVYSFWCVRPTAFSRPSVIKHVFTAHKTRTASRLKSQTINRARLWSISFGTTEGTELNVRMKK